MLITVPVEELQPRDVLDTGDSFRANDEVSEAVRNSRTLVSRAMAVPTRMPELFNRACTVRNAPTPKRIYTYVEMTTYAVVSLRKGSMVSVYRNGVNGPEDGSPAVVEATGPTVSADGRTTTFYNVRVGDTVSVGLTREPEEPEPFSYIARQFRQVGPVENNHFRIKITGKTGETKWLDLHRDDFMALYTIMQNREFRSDSR